MAPIEWQINRAMDALNRIPHATAVAKRTRTQDDLAMVNHVAEPTGTEPLGQDQDSDNAATAMMRLYAYSTSVIQEAQTGEPGRKIIWTPVSYEAAENSKSL
ncbi:hypothetical protein BGZ50_009784, partial [Haplosporangium sp. Z 11]